MEELENTLDLVKAAKLGDSDATERLLARYRPRIRRIVALRMGRRLSEVMEDEDLVQDTMIAVFLGIETFEARSDGAFRHWLATLIENEIRDRARKDNARKRGSGRVQRMADCETDLADSSLPGGDPTPSQELRRKEVEVILHDALLSLSDRHRRIIDLRHLCGLSYDEIKVEMELDSIDAARALFSRAMAKYGLLLTKALEG